MQQIAFSFMSASSSIFLRHSEKQKSCILCFTKSRYRYAPATIVHSRDSSDRHNIQCSAPSYFFLLMKQ